ncbi:MAG: hypothetical protein CSA62_14190 [Planctomycetota bacterium]|nr:MAG: hypothetical protein CSA62_14190 [Planctomycetota bacterium]
MYSTTLPNEYAVPFKVTAPKPVSGLRFYTKSTGGQHTVFARIFKPDAQGLPQAKPLAETLMTVGPTLKMWQASFNKIHLLMAGTYFASFEPYEKGSTTAVILPCQVANGTVKAGKAYWRRSGVTWTSTGIVDKPWFDVLCGGSPMAKLGNTGVPEIGKSFSFDLSQVAVGRAAIGVMGFSKVAWGPIKLPLDLTKVAPGCWIFAPLSFPTAVAAGAGGKAKVTMAIPNNKAFIGIEFYNQYVVIDPIVNSIRLQFSNAGKGKIGG